jgi:rubrerythrin
MSEEQYAGLLEILRTAMQREIMARQHYLDDAERADHPEAKALLLRLAEEEAKHRDLIKAQYEKIAGRALYEENL